MTDKERIAELEARIKELEEAIDWLGDQPAPDSYSIAKYAELRARAFPPKFEEVEVKRWLVEYPENAKEFPILFNEKIDAQQEAERHQDSEPVIIELTGHYKRPIPAKVKHREEIKFKYIEGLESVSKNRLPLDFKESGVHFFMEWEGD